MRFGSLIPQPDTEIVFPAVKVWSPNRWTAGNRLETCKKKKKKKPDKTKDSLKLHLEQERETEREALCLEQMV